MMQFCHWFWSHVLAGQFKGGPVFSDSPVNNAELAISRSAAVQRETVLQVNQNQSAREGLKTHKPFSVLAELLLLCLLTLSITPLKDTTKKERKPGHR